MNSPFNDSMSTDAKTGSEVPVLASLADMVARLQQLSEQCDSGRTLWVGLAGGPGSGKSTLTAALAEQLGTDLLVLPMDGYHLSSQQLNAMADPATAWARRGAPFTFDGQRCVDELLAARLSGHGVFPGFDHAVGDPQPAQYRLRPEQKMVLVEGNYLLLDQQPWCRLKDEVFDECWFMDVDPNTSNQRVLARHMSLGMSADVAQQRVTENDGPNALLVYQQRARADRRVRW